MGNAYFNSRINSPVRISRASLFVGHTLTDVLYVPNRLKCEAKISRARRLSKRIVLFQQPPMENNIALNIPVESLPVALGTTSRSTSTALADLVTFCALATAMTICGV